MIILLCLPLLFSLVEAGEELSLSLAQAIRLALENNPDVKVEEKLIGIREAEIGIERARFDPEFSVSAQDTRLLRPSASLLEAGFGTIEITGIDQDTREMRASLSQRLLTGGSYELRVTNNRFDTSTVFQFLNPSYRSELLLTLTHPLLKGFGPAVAQTELRIAQKNLSLSRAAFKKRVLDLVFDIEQAYWGLVRSLDELRVARQLVESAQTLLTANIMRVKAGILAPTETLVAETGVASQEEQVLVALKNVKDAEDRLRRLLSLPDLPLTEDRPIRPTDVPVSTGVEPVLSQAVHTALQKRPELDQAEVEVDNRELSLQKARNQLFPSLDLRVGVGLSGLAGELGESFDPFFDTDFPRWEAGVTFTFLLGNRGARHTLMKTRLEKERALLAKKVQEQQIILEAKEATRRVETDRKRIEATHKARLLAERKVAVETERLNLGLVSTYDLLRVQDDLAEAQRRELKAITDYNISLAYLEKVKGTLLETHAILLQ